MKKYKVTYEYYERVDKFYIRTEVMTEKEFEEFKSLCGNCIIKVEEA